MITVSMKVKDWKINKDEETKLPKIEGTYLLMMGDKEVAKADFNSKYGSDRKIPFSHALMAEVEQLEQKIVAELQAIIA